MYGIDDQFMEKIREYKVLIVGNAKSTSSSSNKENKKLDRGVRKSVYLHHSLAKETKEQARAGVRKRTIEKRNNKIGGGDVGGSGSDKVMNQNVNRLGSWIPFGENQAQTTDQAE
ncbi:hypothetical protein Lser_V15G40840 [Lactuca serriola]